MALKVCRDCRSEISTSAKACPKCGRPAPGGWFGSVFRVAGCLTAVVGGALLALTVFVAPSVIALPHVAEGRDYTVRVPGGGPAWMARDADAWPALLDAENAGDTDGVARLEGAGRVFREPSGARVSVVERSFAAARVRVIYGANPARFGWVQAEFLKGD